MILTNNIIGKYCLLRTALPEDAYFAIKLRTNQKLNKFLKPVDPSISKQAKWIEEKMDASDDYHMIIQDNAKNKVGIIALYEINLDKGTFNWGRWIIEEKTKYQVSMESALLLYHLAFQILGLSKAVFEVRKENIKVIKFHDRYANRIKEDSSFVYFTLCQRELQENLFMQKFNPYR